ncbi:MAG: helix-turn-helix transcriptional regulator [Clostridia bacterium]|nr:helix-turn-helix transcriptional regulator [Clostridia bacterium]
MIRKFLERMLNKNSKIWIKGSYLVIIILSLIFNTIGYQTASKVIAEMNSEAMSSIVEYMQSSFELYFYDMQCGVDTLVQSVAVQSLVNLPHIRADKKTEYIKNISKELGSVISSNRLLKDGMLILEKQDMCIDFDGMMDLEAAYRFAFQNGYSSKEAWLHDLFGAEIYQKKMISITDTGLFCVYNLQTHHNKEDIAIILKLNDYEINAMLKASAKEVKGDCYILDAQNNLLFTSAQEPLELDIAGDSGNSIYGFGAQKQFVTYTSAEDKEIKYVLCVPEKEVNKKINAVKYSFLFCYLMSIILCGAIAWQFSKISYEKDRRNEEKIMVQGKKIRENLLSQILLRKLPPDVLNPNFFAENNLPLNGKYFVVVAIEVIPLQEQEQPHRSLGERAARKYSIESFSNAIGENANTCFCAIGDFHVGIISYFRRPLDNEEYIHIINNINDVLREKYNYSCICIVSQVTDEISALPDLYWQVAKLINDSFLEKDKVVFSDEEDISSYDRYEYTLAMENNFVNRIRLGEYEAAVQAVNEIFDYNIKERKIDFIIFRGLTMAVGSTIIKNASGLLEGNEYKLICQKLFEANMQTTVDGMKSSIFKMIEIFCEEVKRKMSVGTKLVRSSRAEQIKSFIRENYQDNQICVKMLAEEFGLTPNYLSSKFKEWTGEGIADYIIKCRIEKAKEWLLDEQKTIEYVAAAVGFNSAAVFNRAFKRFEGVSPKQFRTEMTVQKEGE